MALRLEHITKCYGKQKALDDIGFLLKKGEICGFLGPNGAGKSTTMKIATGYLTDYAGKVTLNENDIRHTPLVVKAQIGYLPEHNPLYPEMYIREYLEYAARLYRVPHPRREVDRIIALTGLLPEINKKIGHLSKGFRQRVGLAQALIHDPQVLILDEPMTGLDPNQLEEIRNLILQAGQEKTVLLSTHVMQEVEAICNRVIIIDKGKIVADEPIEKLHTLKANQQLIFVRFAPDSDSNWLRHSAFQARPHTADSWYIDAGKGEDPRSALFYEAASRHCPIIEMRTEEYHLEEIFREVTHRPALP